MVRKCSKFRHITKDNVWKQKYIYGIFRSNLNYNSKKKNSNYNMDKDMKRGFTKKDTQMRNNHMKRCSLSLAIV